jgi:aldehyde dehydrogenase (NAD+)
LDREGRRAPRVLHRRRLREPGETFATTNPATGEALAHFTQATQEDVDRAVGAARAAQGPWAALGGHARARVLYALARLLQKQSRLFAVLETLDNGKPIRESRDIDVPLAIRHFYHHAGYAELLDQEMPGRAPVGVCGAIIPWNFPLLMLAWKVAPALAAGCTVVLKPAEQTPLTALLFADLSRQAGLPPGVLNVVTGDGRVGEMVVGADVDKVAFTGSTAVGRRIREATAGTGKALTLELGASPLTSSSTTPTWTRPSRASWTPSGSTRGRCAAQEPPLVQEGVADAFHGKLRARMDKLRVGDPLDKSVDVGPVVSPEQLAAITRLVEGSEGEHHVAACPVPARGTFYPPTLITGLTSSAPLMQEEIFGPVLVGSTFRTPAEAVELANNTRYGLAATVWTENVSLALDVGPKLAAGVVWVNATNLFDAAAPFGGVRESGFGREGGWEGLGAYLKPAREATHAPVPAFTGDGAPVDALDRTAKLYVGGRQARPDGGYSRPIWGPKGALLGHASLANRKDVRNAVEAASAARGWGRTTGHARAQVLYYLAENLAARAPEFAQRIDALTGGGGAEEVEASVRRLFRWAAWADKVDGRAAHVPFRGVALAMREPVGTVGVLCPDAAPLLGLVAALAPAMAMGNRAVLVASEPFPLASTDLIQVLETSDVPAGVINVLTGSHAELAPTLAAHADVEAVWFADPALAKIVEGNAAGNLKRTWLMDAEAPDRDWIEAATEVKTIWIPYGE